VSQTMYISYFIMNSVLHPPHPPPRVDGSRTSL
jgi:hypothetical protein